MPEPKITKDMQQIVAIEQKRGNIEAVIATQKDRLLKNACALVRSMTPDNQEAFLARTINALLDEKLADCFTSPQGKLSIFRIVEQTMATSLELDKHAYAVPQSKKVGSGWIKVARYDIKRQGYHALLCGGDKPIMRDLRWGVVYEDDKCTIADGEVEHKITIAKTRGEVLGVWVQGEIYLGDKSTKKEAEFYPIDAILQIRDTYSDSWKAFKDGKITACPWNDSPIRQYEKTAIKAFTRPWADVKDALAHAIYEEPGNRAPTELQDTPREEQFEKILDATLAEDAPQETTEAEPIDEKPAEKTPADKAAETDDGLC